MVCCKTLSHLLQSEELPKVFCNPTNLSITRLHYFSCSTTPTMKLASVLFLCTLRTWLFIVCYAPHWLTHLIISQAQNENFPWADHINRIILKQFQPSWNHKTQRCKRRGHRMLPWREGTRESFPPSREQFRGNKMRKMSHKALKFAAEIMNTRWQQVTLKHYNSSLCCGVHITTVTESSRLPSTLVTTNSSRSFVSNSYSFRLLRCFRKACAILTN